MYIDVKPIAFQKSESIFSSTVYFSSQKKRSIPFSSTDHQIHFSTRAGRLYYNIMIRYIIYENVIYSLKQSNLKYITLYTDMFLRKRDVLKKIFLLNRIFILRYTI